jgi:hypothetical protein
VQALLDWVASLPPYRVALGFVAAYPLTTGVMWTLTSLIFFRRNEREPMPVAPDEELPDVSVVVAAHCEEAVIERTPAALLGRRAATSHWRTERVVADEEAVALA